MRILRLVDYLSLAISLILHRNSSKELGDNYTAGIEMHSQTHSFRFAEEVLNAKLDLKNEVFSILGSIKPISVKQDRPALSLHRQIIQQFKDEGWQSEEPITNETISLDEADPIHPKTYMRFDLFKDKVAIEVEASHVVHCYKDFLKFLVGFNDQRIDVGIEIVYADEYAKSLGGGSLPTFGKVRRELEDLFRSVIPVPILVIGLEP